MIRPAPVREPEASLPRGFWSRVVAARHRLLMLDYDGTLAPFRVRPDEAVPAPGALPLLDRLSGDRGTTVAIVSGRPLDELEALLGAVPLVRVAEHGWDVRWPDGRRLSHAVPAAVARLLADAASEAEAAIPDGRIERKRAAVVLHTRGVEGPAARAAVETCRRIWGAYAAGPGMRLDATDGGLELRARGRDKGDVVRWLLGVSPPDTLPVYLGDDTTDEDAFRVVLGRGFAIRVGPSERPSAARARLPSPQDVVDFLEEWIRRTDRARRPGGGIR